MTPAVVKPCRLRHDAKISGTTSTGRATCNRLDLNDQRRSDRFMQKSRQLWIKAGFHPPPEDPRQ